MRIELKSLDGKQWGNVPIEKLKGNSIINFIEDELSPTIAAIYDNEEPIFYVSNTDRYKEMMEKKGKFCVSVSEMKALMGENGYHSLVAKELPGSKIIDIRSAEKQQEIDVTDGQYSQA